MSLLASSSLLFAVTAIAAIACAPAMLPAQAPSDPDVEALLDKIDAARGATPTSLRVDGTYTVHFEGAGDEPVARGAFHEIFDGVGQARHTSETGAEGTMEKGTTGDLTWEVDPMMGAVVRTGAHAAAVQRWFAILRNVGPRSLYRDVERVGTETIAGRTHAVLRGTPVEGTQDTWTVDVESGLVRRIDIALPTPESANATFGLDDAMPAQVTFDDVRDVGDMHYPYRRVLQMGPATVTFVCTTVEPGAEIDAAKFTPPDAVRKAARTKPTSAAFDADGKPVYQIIERDAQPVASIRVKCKPEKISATLAVLLPEVMAHLNAKGARMVGAPFSRYHGFDGDQLDLEAGIPVAGEIEEGGRVRNSELPAGNAVMAWHVGPYDGLSAAHRALEAWAKAHDLEPRGGPWEIYWTDPGMVVDPAKWRTQLFLPVEGK